MSATQAPGAVARWQWHPEVREVWGGERLYFWRVSFPTYERSKFLEHVQEVMARIGVTGYAVYELYGGFDMLMRVWLPTTTGVFEQTFHDVFRGDNIVIEGFSVTEIVAQWPWMDEEGEMRRLDASVLAERMPNREIERINAGLDLAGLASYQERGVLAPAWHSQGIKFIVLIGNSNQSKSRRAEARVTAELLRLLLDADDDSFSEKSLYKGMGFGSYLMLARVKPDKFHRIEREITEPINELIAPETFGSRTTTFVMSTEDFLDFQDQMRPADEPPHKRTAREWLADEESQHLEVKGSAFFELNRWLLSSGREERPLESDVPTNSLLKAICGLLNAEGGTVIIGALEADRYPGNERVVDSPRVGSHAILGLHPDGGRDWDKYARRLRDVVASRIKPDANDLIDIDRDGAGEGRPLCVLTIRAPMRSRDAARWFYHYAKGEQPRFWVREGNRTREKVGPDIDVYKAEKTRRAI